MFRIFKNPRMKIVVLDPSSQVYEVVPYPDFVERFPSIPIHPFVSPEGKIQHYAFVSELPQLSRVDLQDAYWQKLSKWLLAAPSPSAKFPSILVLIVAFAIGIAIGIVF